MTSPRRIELPSGKGWVEVRTELTPADKWAVDGCYDVQVNPDGHSVIPGDLGSRKMKAFLARVITAWSFAETGTPIPEQNIGGPDVIGTAITDLDDYNALEDGVADLFEKVNRNPNRQRAARSSSGS